MFATRQIAAFSSRHHSRLRTLQANTSLMCLGKSINMMNSRCVCAVGGWTTTLFDYCKSSEVKAIQTQRRSKSEGRQRPSGEDEETSDSESDVSDDSDSDEEGEQFPVHPEDADMPSNFKDTIVHSASLRVDAILAKALQLSRRVVDDAYLGSKIRHNDEKLLKKSKQIRDGDSLELIISNREGVETFKRVRINKINKELTSSGKNTIYVRSWRGQNKREVVDSWK